MGAWLIVHPDEQDYLNQFYYPEARKILFPPEDPVQLGQQILDGKGGITIPCSGCHTLNSMGWTAKIGPDLDGIGSRAGNRIPGMSAADYIHDSLRNPQHYIVPGFTSVRDADLPEHRPECTELYAGRCAGRYHSVPANPVSKMQSAGRPDRPAIFLR